MSELTLERLLDLENQGWQSLCTSTGGDFYGSLMTPEAVMILVNGWVLDRRDVARSLDASPPWSSYTISDARLVPTGERSAALVYRASATRDGEVGPFEALMTSHYRLEDGRIGLTLYQQTTATH